MTKDFNSANEENLDEFLDMLLEEHEEDKEAMVHEAEEIIEEREEEVTEDKEEANNDECLITKEEHEMLVNKYVTRMKELDAERMKKENEAFKKIKDNGKIDVEIEKEMIRRNIKSEMDEKRRKYKEEIDKEAEEIIRKRK